MKVPKDFPVRPIRRGSKAEDTAQDLTECGTCHRRWDDAIVTSMTPAPSARCPFGAFHG